MGVSCKVGAFSTGTGAVNSTQDITCGFQPMAVIVWFSGMSGSSDAAAYGNSLMGHGFFSRTQRACTVSGEDNGASSMSCCCGFRGDCFIATLTVNTNTWDGMVDVDAFANWPSDGFRLIVDDVMPLDLRVGFIAFGGSDITDVSVDVLTGATSGNFDFTLSGSFQPDVVFF